MASKRCACDACVAVAVTSDGYCPFCDTTCFPGMEIDGEAVGRASVGRNDRLRLHGAVPQRPPMQPLQMHPVGEAPPYLPRKVVDLFLETLPNPRVRAGAQAALAVADYLVPIVMPEGRRLVQQAKTALKKRRKKKG